MPNLLTPLMPEMGALAPQALGAASINGSGKIALFSEGFTSEGADVTFPETLSEQLAGVTAWMNLTAEGGLPAALMLPADGNSLPLVGEAIQPSLDDGAEDLSLGETVYALPLLPPGMVLLEATGATPGKAGDVLTLTNRDQGVNLAAAAKEQSSSGVSALLNGSTSANKAAPEAPAVLESDAGEMDRSLLQVLRQTVTDEQGALRRDPQALRSMINALQAAEGHTLTAPLTHAITATTPSALTSGVSSFPQLTLDIPPGQPGWSEALGDRINWILNNQQPGAQLRINPPHLGPLEIKVSVHNDQASISFTAHHAVTADHLEAALPRLREMLAESGLQLAHFDVRQQGSGSEAQRESPQDAAHSGNAHEDVIEGEEGEAATLVTRIGDRMVDAYV